MAKVIQVLFPGLTTNGKVYGEKEIEREPNDYLKEIAKRKVRQFHRDSGRMLRLARFVHEDSLDEEWEDEDEVVRTPTRSFIDDLTDLSKEEILTISGALGLKKSFGKTLEIEKLRKITRFLRTV